MWKRASIIGPSREGVEAQAAATALRARQAEVNVRADAAKPEVTLGDRFIRLDRHRLRRITQAETG